ncbi:MAG: mannose-6-phosphate isomerase, class I [Micromonosporaceae bacterium]
MRRLAGRIRPYAWGSRTGIAALQGRPAPSAGPEAELWLGAHPDDPSLLLDPTAADLRPAADPGPGADSTAPDSGRSLLAAVEADPEGMLGVGVVKRFGARLPYLLKVLAAERPLSLQAHPDLAQARAGYAAEEAAGVPRDAGHRNYSDPNHKPELLVAVSEFVALCGFRPAGEAAALLDRLRLPELGSTVDSLRAGELRTAVRGLYELDSGARTGLVERVAESCRGLAGAAPEYAEAADLADRYPGDLGVLVSLLLNRAVLRPGEAIYMPAGNPHAYLRGVGVEVMASSDNVLRGGLTPKYVDVPELLRVLRYTELPEPRLAPVPAGDGVVWWPAPVPDFRLARASLTGGRVTLPLPGGASPRIVFCLTGTVRVDGPDGGLALGAGEAAFVPATEDEITAAGTGELYQATTGEL